MEKNLFLRYGFHLLIWDYCEWLFVWWCLGFKLMNGTKAKNRTYPTGSRRPMHCIYGRNWFDIIAIFFVIIMSFWSTTLMVLMLFHHLAIWILDLIDGIFCDDTLFCRKVRWQSIGLEWKNSTAFATYRMLPSSLLYSAVFYRKCNSQ